MNIIKNKILLLFLALSLICPKSIFAAEQTGVNMEINGQLIEFADTNPFIDENNRTQIPLRSISEELGYEVEWDEAEQRVTVRNGDYWCRFKIKADIGYMCHQRENGNIEYGILDLDTCPTIVNDRIYIPLRAMCSGFNIYIEWDETTSTAIIDTAKDYYK